MMKLFTSTLTSSLLWGGAAAFGYYFSLQNGLIQHPLLVRYTAGHPVEYITVALFFIGMTSLLFKWGRIFRQGKKLTLGPVFPPIKEEREGTDQAGNYLNTIEKAEVIRGRSLHLNRLRKAIFFLKSNGKADELDQELRSLADDDAFEAEREYGMVRMFIWAIPILGFLGTVVGITMALGHLDLTELETSSQQLATGLNVAFDTTALALSLVFFLYFSLFFVQQREKRLFERINRLVDSELRGRFVNSPSRQEQKEFQIVEQMLQTVAETFDSVLKTQVERWAEAISKMEEVCTETFRQRGEQLHQSFSQSFNQSFSDSLNQSFEAFQQSIESFNHSINESARQHAQLIAAGEEKLLSETLTPYIRAMKEGGEAITALRSQMYEEGKLFQDILQTAGTVTKLEDRLNQNLQTLSESNRFAETVQSLAETVQRVHSKRHLSTPASASDIIRDSASEQEIPSYRPDREIRPDQEIYSTIEESDETVSDSLPEESFPLPGRRSFLPHKMKRGKTA